MSPWWGLNRAPHVPAYGWSSRHRDLMTSLAEFYIVYLCDR